MKIAFIVSVFPALSETFILNQITGLMDLGHEVDIYSRYNPNECKVHDDIEKYNLMDRVCYYDFFNIPPNKIKRVIKGIKLIVTNFYKDPLGILRALNVFKYGKDAMSLKLLYTIIPFLGKRNYYDIIHCHFGPNGEWGILLKRLGVKGKIITSFYGYDASAYIDDDNIGIYKNLFNYGDIFIVICNYIKNKLIKLECNENKIIKHPLGVDIEKFNFKKIQKSNNNINILTIARLVEKKGIEYSIKAVAKVIKKYPNLKYIIVGDGPLKDQLLCLISELGINEQVKILGWKAQNEIIELFKKSHIFVLASITAQNGDQEGTPTVLLEAQATGLPIISTFHSGIPEIVLDGQSGFLVPERDVDAMAGRLEYLIEHTEIWTEMGRAGRKFVEENFDIKKLNKQLVEIYENII